MAITFTFATALTGSFRNANRLDFDAPHVSRCSARECAPAALDYLALRWRDFTGIGVRETIGFAALQLEVESRIAGAHHTPQHLAASAGRRNDDLAELRVGGIVNLH